MWFIVNEKVSQSVGNPVSVYWAINDDLMTCETCVLFIFFINF